MPKETFAISTDSETLEGLDALAEALNATRDQIADRALKAFIDEQFRQIEAIREGIRSLDAGDVISHEDLMAELRARLADKARPAAE